MFLAAAAASIALSLPAPAAGVPPTAAAEVERLLATLGNSECSFFRNGTWHGPAEAQSHLRTKYEYLVRKKMIHSTEDFIAGAGEKSSLSGQAYQVKCTGEASQPSAAWLRARLAEIRRADAKR